MFCYLEKFLVKLDLLKQRLVIVSQERKTWNLGQLTDVSRRKTANSKGDKVLEVAKLNCDA